MSVGGNLKRVREDSGISQKELSEIVGVSQPMIAQIERGTKSMTMELGKEIASALHCDVKEFLWEMP